MTLYDLLASATQPDLAALRQVFLVFDAALCQRMVNVQAWHGDPRHVPVPVSLTDGRWMLCGDILTECVEGGIVWGGFSHLDSSRFSEIEVLSLADVEIADPQSPQLVADEKPKYEELSRAQYLAAASAASG